MDEELPDDQVALRRVQEIKQAITLRKTGVRACPDGRFNKQTIYRQVYRFAFKPFLLHINRSNPSQRPGFDEETKKILCGDTLQGILLAFRQFPEKHKDFKIKLLTLHHLKKEEIKQEKKLQYNKTTLNKLLTILDLMTWVDFQLDISIEIFIKEVTNAGNINQTCNEKDVQKYKEKEERFKAEMKIKRILRA